MTIALISDVHGNFEALRAVLAEIDKTTVSRIVCLGDVAGYYPQVNECCEALRERDVLNLMGNHDWYMVGGHCSRSRSAQACIEYQRTIITPSHKAWLAASPVYDYVEEVQVVHGGWTDPIDEYLDPETARFDSLSGRYFASGHTHIPVIRKYQEKTYCNPGSVGMPRDGDPRASYALFSHGEFEIRRVLYDPRPIFSLMEAAGFNDYYYGGLLTGAPRLTRLPHQE